MELATPQIALLRAYLGLLKSDLFEVCITYKFIFLALLVSERQNLINPVQATERSAVRGYNGKLRTHRGAGSWYFETLHQLAAKDTAQSNMLKNHSASLQDQKR